MHQHVLAGTTQDGIGAIKGKAQGHASILRHGEDLDWGCRVGKGPQGNIPTPCARHKHLLVGAVARQAHHRSIRALQHHMNLTGTHSITCRGL